MHPGGFFDKPRIISALLVADCKSLRRCATHHNVRFGVFSMKLRAQVFLF